MAPTVSKGENYFSSRQRAFFGEETSSSVDEANISDHGTSNVVNNNNIDDNTHHLFVKRQRAFIGEDSSSIDDSRCFSPLSDHVTDADPTHKTLFVQRQRAFSGEQSSSTLGGHDNDEERSTNNDTLNVDDADERQPPHVVTIGAVQTARQKLNSMLLKGARKTAL